MKRLVAISLGVSVLASCGSSVDLNRSGGDIAYSVCAKALGSIEVAISDDEFMVVQIFDSGKHNGSSLKKSRFFTYPALSEGTAEVSAACKVDMRAEKIIKLSYKKQSILDDVSEELRTF